MIRHSKQNEKRIDLHKRIPRRYLKWGYFHATTTIVCDIVVTKTTARKYNPHTP